MTETEQKPQISGENQENRNPDGTFKKGFSGNPEGKPVGTTSFKTKWENFIEKVAAQNEMTPEEIDEQLLAVGFKKAKEGDYQFYKDIHDRVHGKAVQPMEHKGNVDIGIRQINIIVPEKPEEQKKENDTTNGETMGGHQPDAHA